MKSSDFNYSDKLVLDASAFYSGIHIFSGKKCYTTSKVFDEINHIKKSFSIMESLIDSGNLIIQDPSDEIIDFVISKSKQIGNYNSLSSADISIISLAYDLKLTLITDDFAVQNLSLILGINVRSLGNSGIKKLRRYINYCPCCGKVYNNQIECTACGVKIKRKYKKSNIDS